MRLNEALAPQLPLELGPARPTLPLLDRATRGAAFVGLEARSVVNSPASTGMDFWTLNPYVGCEFGCCYCYARAPHRYTAERHSVEAAGPPEMSPSEAFERLIFVKRNAARLLARSLDPGKLAGRPLLIGTATDPYQPAERRFQITRTVLEALAGFRGLEIWITTKSPLVARDTDLLRALAARHDVSVCVSIMSLDAGLVRRLEPRSPLPVARLHAIRALAEAMVPVGPLIAPIIPGLTDGWATLGSVMAAAKEAGASFAVGSALRLGNEARTGLLPVLEREFPDLVPAYRRRYGRRQEAGKVYLAALDRRLRTLQAIHGFPVQSLRYGNRE